MKKSVIFSFCLAATLLSGCGTTFNFSKVKPIKQFNVVLRAEVRAEGDILTNDRGNNPDCTAFAKPLKKGCFVAKEGEVLELKFKLIKSSEGADWRLTKLEICAGTTKPDTKNPCTLNDKQQGEWLVFAENQLAVLPSNGTVDLTTFAHDLLKFSVLDINAHPGNYTYRIQACKEKSLSPADCVWMDPGGTNIGR